jgi:cell division protein FtsB
MVRKVLFLAFIIFSIGVIHSLVVSINDLWSKRTVLSQAQKELVLKQKENMHLKHQLSQAQSPGFIEKEARDKLFLTKPGEELVLVPQNIKEAQAAPTPTPEPNWKQWVEVFIK